MRFVASPRHLSFLSFALCAVVAACGQSSSTDSGGASATPTPTPPPQYRYDTTNSQPQNCVRRTDGFRYYDALSRSPMPFLQSYSPYPLPIINYILATPSPPPPGQPAVAIEESPGNTPAAGISMYEAEPLVPVMVLLAIYGVKDNATVLLVPSGSIAVDYIKDLKYHYVQDSEASEYVYERQQGQNPTPLPSDDAGKAFDTEFQAYGVPALNAISVGAGADDRFFKDYTTNGQPTQDADPHPRLITCDWLQYRPYDVIVTLIRRRQLPPAQLAALIASMKAQEAPSAMLTGNTDVGWVSFEKDVYVFPAIMPQLVSPTTGDAFGQGSIDNNAMIFQATAITPSALLVQDTVRQPFPALPLAAPDDTAPPS